MSNGVAHGELVLFDCPRTRRPELWQFVRLVAPAGAPPAGQSHWLSQDATDAFCLRCSRLFRFQKGSSNSVRRHMERHHGKELARLRAQAQADAAALAAARDGARPERRPPKRLAAPADEPGAGAASPPAEAQAEAGAEARAEAEAETEAGEARPAAKRQRRAAPTSAQRDGEERLLRWLCAGRRPLSVVEDPGFAEFVAELSVGDQGFKTPSFDAATHRLKLMAESLRFDAAQKIKKHTGSFSLSTEVWTVEDVQEAAPTFVAVVCHFLNDEFRRTSFPLDVLQLSNVPVDLRERIMPMLSDWRLHKRHISLILSNSQLAGNDEVEKSTGDEGRGQAIRLFDDVLSRLSGRFLNPGSLNHETYSLMTQVLRELQEFVRSCRENVIVRCKLVEFWDARSNDLWIFDAPTKPSRHEVAAESWIETSRLLDKIVAWRPVFESLAVYSSTADGQDAFGEAFCSQKSPTERTWLVAEVVAALLHPLQELYDVLHGRERKRMCITPIPFMLQCLTMVKQQLESEALVADACDRVLRQHNGTSEGISVMDSRVERDTLIQLDQVRTWITDQIFGFSTSAALVELGWCSVLDPRCARKQIPDEAREACKSAVVEKAVALISTTTPSSTTAESASNSLEFDGSIMYGIGQSAPPPAQGLMHRLLYDDDDEVPTSDGLSRDANIEHARLCAANEIELFMSEHQTRKSRISCPLEWWRSNHERYPLLAPLARTWLGAVASTGNALHHSLRQEVWNENLRRASTTTTRNMIMLHVATRLEQAQLGSASISSTPMPTSWTMTAPNPYAV